MRRVEFLDPSHPRFGSDEEPTDEEIEAERDEQDDREYQQSRDDRDRDFCKGLGDE